MSDVKVVWTRFTEIVEKHSDKIAVFDAVTSGFLTYGELQNEALSYAAALKNCAEQTIVLIGEPDLNALPLFLACAASGRCFVPLSDQEPLGRLIEIIGSGILEVQLLVSSKWLSWLVKDYPIQILVDETKKSYDATIEYIGANIDPVSQTIDITAKFLENHDSLLPGMSGTASF